MNLKRTLSLLLCLAFTLGMFATCGAAGGRGSAAEPEATEAPEAAEEPAAETEAEAEAAPGTATVTVGGTDGETAPAAADANPFAAAIVTDDGLEEADLSSGKIYGGTNQNDAVLLPMNTKLYGTATENALWYAFTTLPDPEIVYRLTFINMSFDGDKIYFRAYDQAGNFVSANYSNVSHYSSAGNNGCATTLTLNNTEPNTVYYIYIWSDSGSVDYRLNITPEGAVTEGYGTADNLFDARGDATAAEGLIAPGTNMDDAGYLPLNTKISASISNYHDLWFAFTTNETEGTYSFSMVNETAGSDPIYVTADTVYGGRTQSNFEHWSDYDSVESDGVTHTRELKVSPNTTYYLQLWTESETPIQYTLILNAPEAPATPEPATVEPLIFETPFELNETKIMFVGDEATFIDEAAAREACAPVAEVILAHPEHQVLLVGTTASNGSDEYCLDLSSRRAAAVKDLLVSAYGVPEDQLLSVGLGYKNDPFARANDLDANGNLIESEAGKNRRVIVLDAEDPIAQEILASNG